MHGCTSGFMLIVNAEFDSMGGVIDTGVGISSKPSLQQSSDLEKTQAELRQTFTAAEKFRRELEFLQKGGDPLDLKPGNAASISFQSTSLTADRHLTSEAKGSFAITASPHGDSVESSGRLGAPSVCEPNSADNLMLFDGANNINLSKLDVGHISKESGVDSAVLELPKKSYKRRIRSRPNRDGARSSSTDAVPSRGAHFLPFRHASNSNPKSPNELDGVPAGQSTLGPPHGPYSAVLDANVIQNTQENHQYSCRFFTLLAVSGSLIGSILCFIKGCAFVVSSFQEYFVNHGKGIFMLVDAIDVYLLGTVMLVFGMGLYELFISNLDIAQSSSEEMPTNKSNLFGLFVLKERPKWLEIKSVNALKTKLGHVIVMLLLIGLFEKSKKAAILTPTDLLCFSGCVLLSSCCLYLLSKLH